MAEYKECEKYVKLNDIIETLEYQWGYEGMREDLYNLPAADVVEVVRCSECKHHHDPMRCALWYGTLGDNEYFLEHGKDFYCAFGERRSE